MNLSTLRARKKILLVEDDPDQLLIRTLLFERHGFLCLQAADGVSAAQLAAGQCPDCIVMDLSVPTEQDGFALIHTAGILPKSPRIVILTGHRAANLRARPELQHIFAFVEKGGPTADLVAAVERACG